ncbi:MAG: prephenate dehydratase [Gammaproteobacteria bacterium]|nr:prephenate dehydratase [Gammaproteobacteria bacterium]MDD9814791.1 prephenate dehydratase [Gammaproteobacteria bacterium]
MSKKKAAKKTAGIEKLRGRIDDIDRRIHQLLNRRVRHALDIAGLKTAAGDREFYSPEREAEVLREAQRRNRESRGLLSDAEAGRVFREIMSATLAAERATKVAVLGPAGTYTQSAALKHFGGSAHTVPVAAIADIFREVESGNIGFGVAPVENSSEGSVADTLELLMKTPLRICGEVELRIQHCLLGGTKKMSTVKTVLAHPQALAQCRQWLEHRLPGADVRQTSSNAEAARRAARMKNAAAIAGELSAGLYNLNILARGIEDNPRNHTRFIVIGDITTRPTGHDKTSLLIAGRNKPGALYNLLAPIRDAGLDMTRIESRPTRSGLWEYVFFIDFTGHRGDKPVARALGALEEQAALCKVLGSYPRSVL